MAIKYASTPQIRYGTAGSRYNFSGRFPPEARNINTAPQNLATPIVVAEPSGKAHLAIPTKHGWQKVGPVKDVRGNVSLRGTGERIVQPVMWWMPKRG